jgi:hypothetical protein
MLSGNVGEWSEIFVVLRLLADGHVALCNSRLEPIPGKRIKVLEVHRTSSEGILKFSIDPDGETIRFSSGDVIGKRDELEELLIALLMALRAGGKSIELPQLESLLARMRTYQLAAPSSGKSDLKVLVEDGVTGRRSAMSFSVKSQIGGAATLLNASSATTFRYEATGPKPALNSLARSGMKTSKMLAESQNLGVTFSTGRPINETFRMNLQMIDTGMPGVLASMLFGHFSGEGAMVSDVMGYLEAQDPLEVGTPMADVFYEHKIKDFLVDVALGMTPSKRWDGTFVTSAGFLIVTRVGQVVCLLFEDRDVFREYLYTNTKFERGSQSRHKYGSLVNPPEAPSYLDLNLQIRFTK